MGHNVEQRRNTHTQEHMQHTWAKPHTNTMVQQHKHICTKTDTNTEWGIMSTKDTHQVESKGTKEIQKHTNTTTTTKTCTHTHNRNHHPTFTYTSIAYLNSEADFSSHICVVFLSLASVLAQFLEVMSRSYLWILCTSQNKHPSFLPHLNCAAIYGIVNP